MIWKDYLSLILVGAFWGCTNPLLRKGSVEAASATEPKSTASKQIVTSLRGKTAWRISERLIAAFALFRNVRVWVPYAVNQLGSLLFYVTLSTSDLSLAVPICNALALIFSIATSYLLGERVDRPIRTIFGASFVMAGIALCLVSRQQETDTSSRQ